MTTLKGLLLTLLVSGVSVGSLQPKNRPYDVSHYLLELKLDPATDPHEFDADLTATLKTKDKTSKIVFDAEQLVIKRVVLVGKSGLTSLPFTAEEKELVVDLGRENAKGTPLKLKITYTGKIVREDHFGMFRVEDPDEPERGPLFFTQLEAQGARRVFPCNDEPYDKASTEVKVTVPGDYMVVSNGSLESRKTSPTQKAFVTYNWLQKDPHPVYLVSLAIGKFEKLEAAKKPQIDFYVGKSKVNQLGYAVDCTKTAMKFFENYIGVKYPWKKYATVGVPTFFWGGMENTSSTHNDEEQMLVHDAVSEREKKSVAALAAHELAHQWFGNDVTLKWWNDLWLNESFASHLETQATKHIFKNHEADVDLLMSTWDWYFRMEDGPRSHPIVNDDLEHADDAFDAVSYTKGENVLRMLRFYIGEAAFKKSIQSYVKAFTFGNATYLDFFKLAEKAHKKDLSHFRDSWLLQRGYPIIEYSGEWNAKTKMYSLTITQRPNHESDKAVFDFVLPVSFSGKKPKPFNVVRKLPMSKSESVYKINLPSEPTLVSVNLQNIVLSKVQQKTRDEKILAQHMREDKDPFVRIWAAYQFLQALFDGKSLSSTGEAAIADILASDPDPYVRNAVLGGFARMKSPYLPEKIGQQVWSLASQLLATSELPAQMKKDTHGWRLFRTGIAGTLGRVQDKDVNGLLSKIIQDPVLPLDDLSAVSKAVAMQGTEETIAILKTARGIHASRGFRYEQSIMYAFGAYQDSRAASELKEIALTAPVGFMARLPGVIKDNNTLKESKEWAQFLEDFILKDKRFGEAVKYRMFETVEQLKTSAVQQMLENVVAKTDSQRLKDAAKNILEKNYSKVL